MSGDYKKKVATYLQACNQIFLDLQILVLDQVGVPKSVEINNF